MAVQKPNKRKRKKPHKGVTLIKPDPKKRMGWRARVVDVDTCKIVDGRVAISSGKTNRVTLPEDVTTAEQREAWAVEKAGELAKRVAELQGGAPKATGATLADTIGLYYKNHPKLRAKTKLAYEGATDKLVAWAEEARITKAEKLTRAELLRWRATVLAETKKVRAKGGKRGEVKVTEEPRSNYTINRELRGVRTVLGYLVDLDLFAKLRHDDLRRALKRLKVDRERVEYLRPAQIKLALQAALDHDAATYTETRDEHRGIGVVGTTPKYTPIAPFTAFALLGGCRLDEIVRLDWPMVDLDALDQEGHIVGEIHLPGSTNKTHQARDVGLDVSLALRTLLAAMREHNDEGSVFGVSRGEAEAAMKRLRDEYKAPKKFTWQLCRKTCETFLVNAPGIYGSASVYRAAKQLGHEVAVAEKHYLGLVRGIPPDGEDTGGSHGYRGAGRQNHRRGESEVT